MLGFRKKKIIRTPSNDSVFHSAAGTKNAGSYSNISGDGKALVPQAGLAQRMANKKADVAYAKKADKKLKGFKYGVGVGP